MPRGDGNLAVDWEAQVALMQRAAEERHAELPPPHELTAEQCELQQITFLHQAGVPPRYHEARWDDVWPATRTACREWLDRLDDHIRRPCNLWIGGNVGVGKSMAAALVIRELAETPYEAAYVHAVYLFHRLVKTRSLDELWPEYVAPDLLVIDDLGREYDAAWPLSSFVWLAEQRYGYHRATFVTSNKEPKALREDGAWEPAVSRICQDVVGAWQEGEDRRLVRTEAGKL